jgi:hypothetical protein
LSALAMFVNGSKMSNLYRGPSIAIRVADWSIRKKSSTLKSLGQMNRNVVGSIYGRPSIKIAHFVYESTNQQHELPVLAMFVNGSKISNLYRGPSIDATYHVSVHLAERFRRFLKNLLL